MTDTYTNSAITSEFGREFEAERERRLRRHFLWYSGGLAAIYIVKLLWAVADTLTRADVPDSQRYAGAAVAGAVGLFISVIYSGAFLRAYRTILSRDQIIRAVTFLIVGHGAAHFVGGYLTRDYAPAISEVMNISLGAKWMGGIFLTHLLACCALPLTPREAIRPLIPLFAIHIASEFVSSDSLLDKCVTTAVWPVVGVPGALVCWWRHGRLRERFAIGMLRGRYFEMRRELTDARRIHEALFPKPLDAGPVQFRYAYEPMRQIGGDYLHAFQSPPDPAGGRALNLVLVDVTGHGIPAALTVNRLHGELARIFAERPRQTPGEVLRLLNSYVHLTLADHSVYVTALCLRIDPARGELDYASGGHPPAFLRAVDGTIEQLPSTTFVLGACPGEHFRPDERTLPFGPGDTLIAYTDGATEARDRAGRYLGVDGLQRALVASRPAGESWLRTIAEAVDRHRFGPIADDMLVVEVTRPITTKLPTPDPARLAASAS